VFLARWLQLGSIADAVDGAAVLVAWRHLPRVARYADLGMALGAALANMLVARQIPEHNDNPSPQ
jgi:hypothetical protein